MALTKISNNSLSAISTLPASIPTGALTLLSTQTASSSASIEFTSGIDSTYSSYVFKFIDIHPQTDGAYFEFQFSTDSGSTYATTITSTSFNSAHNESDSVALIQYVTADDLAQSTSFQRIAATVGADNDQSTSGTMQIFNPSSTTYVKHFIANLDVYNPNDYSASVFTAGYANTTLALTNIKFQMSSGNIDDGKILMFGIN